MRRFAIVLAGLILLGGTSYVAAAIGYILGGPQYAARFTPADAAYTVVVLQALRNGDVESATSLLETQLDSQIVEHSTFNPHIASWLDLATRDQSASNELMARVAAYRADHPSSASGKVQAAINAHLASFQP